jgi:hypothetical protein
MIQDKWQDKFSDVVHVHVDCLNGPHPY